MRLLVSLFLLASTLIIRADSNLAGRWEGAVEIPGSQLRVIVDLAPGENAIWTGSITIRGLGMKGAELSDIVIHDSDATFAIKDALSIQPAARATFKAELRPDGTLSGKFSQAGNE